MSIQFGDLLQHNNLLYPIVDINDVKGGLRSIATFSSPALISEYTSIPEKYRTGYSLLLETSTGTIYYLAGSDATNVSHWSPVGISGNGYGVANTIPKWTNSSTLGNSNITDNGDTVVINGNLQVIGTTSTISSQNLLVKDPIILLAGSQSGTPTYDAGLFVNRGSSDTQAFIWDESMGEFKFITTTSGATVSGDVIIGTYSTVRTGILRVGTQSVDSNDRFIVSSSGGTVSLVVDENGYVYNRGRGNISTNTAFGFMTLGLNTSGNRNTAFGASALSVNTTGSFNTAIGQQALMSNLSGSYNTALGHQVLNQNTSGQYNIGIGINSLRSLKTSSYNIAIGGNSQYNAVSSSSNLAIGYNTLFSNTIGSNNLAIGYQSLYSNTTTINSFSITNQGSGYVPGTYSNVPLIYATGSTAISYPNVTIVVDGTGVVTSITGTYLGSGFQDYSTRMTINNAFLGGTGSGFEVGISLLLTGNYNIGLGAGSLLSNTTGSYNTGLGYNALLSNVTGSENSALGFYTLNSNTTGYNNVALGNRASYYNTTGYSNTSIGFQSFFYNTTGYNNVSIGERSSYNNTINNDNVSIGYNTLYKNNTGNYNTAIGSLSLRNNTTRLETLAATFSPGSGYTPGTYSNIVLFGIGGTNYYPGNSTSDYPQVTIVVGAGGTVSSVTLTWSGSVIPDSTIVFGIQTGFQTYQLPPGGSGFSINTGTIKSAGTDNTAIGHSSLYELRSGSRNVALGKNAGSYYNLLDTNDSIYIGYNANSFSSNQINEIVIGATALGNGSNSVTLGNDNITKTILKGNVGIGGVTNPNCELEIKGHKTYTLPDTPGSSGEIVYFGDTTGLTIGKIYVLDKTAFDSIEWKEADNTGLANGLLAIALGTSSDDGMLLRGYVSFTDTSYTDMADYGNVQYLGTGGEFTEIAPTGSGEIVRVIGYCINKNNFYPMLYFCPDTTWIELT